MRLYSIFDGIDDGLNTNDINNLTDFTVSFWFNRTGTIEWDRIIIGNNVTIGAYYSNKMFFDGPDGVDCMTGGIVPGLWQYHTYRWDSNGATVRRDMYLNGNNVKTNQNCWYI